MLILLWGLPNEGPIAAVAQSLSDAGAPFVFLNQRHVLRTRVKLSVGKQVSGRISLDSLQIDLEDIAAAYIRPYESRMLTAVQKDSNTGRAQSRAAAVDEILLNWLDITPALVLNRPRHMATNSAKPYQSQLIRRFGFRIPETLITTSPTAVQEFRQLHDAVIYKSASGVRSRVTRLTPAHAKRLQQIKNCPTQFQEFIPGCDFRAHVVGSQVFASELVCDADDYRYPAGRPLQIKAANIPTTIEDRCINLAKSMGLQLAGIDLRRTPEGEWYCFEVNPSPAFTFYQDSTGQPIAAAIASLLMSGTRDPTPSASSFDRETPLLAMEEAVSIVPASIWN